MGARKAFWTVEQGGAKRTGSCRPDQSEDFRLLYQRACELNCSARSKTSARLMMQHCGRIESYRRRINCLMPMQSRWRKRLPLNWRSSRSEEHTSELQSHVNLVCRL